MTSWAEQSFAGESYPRLENIRNNFPEGLMQVYAWLEATKMFLIKRSVHPDQVTHVYL